MPPTAAPVQLTEKLLINAGGWDAIRHARGIREAGRVSGANWVPPMLQGFVREGERELRSGLKILGESNVENICTCRASREFGTICAHALAVGLSVLAREQISSKGAEAAQPQPRSVGRTAASPPPPAVKTGPTLPYRADENAAARLHVVLAPDLPAAWAKNQLLFGLELTVNGKRGMFGAPGLDPTNTLLPQDFGMVEALAKLTNATPGGLSFVNRAQFLELLGPLTDHPRLALGKSGRLVVSADPVRPPLRGTFNADGSLQLAVRTPEGSRVLAADKRAFLLRPGVRETTLQPLAPGLPAAYLSLFDAPPRLPAQQAAAFLNLEWPKLAPFFELRADPPPPTAAPGKPGAAVPALAHVAPGTPQWALSIEGSLTQLGARMQAVYPNKRVVSVGVTPERDTFTYAPPDAAPGTLHTRNQAAERGALGRLISWGFHGPDTGGNYFLRGEDRVLRFFALGLPDWQREPGWQVTVGSRFQGVSRQIEIIKPEVAVRASGQDWFEMELSLTGSSGERFSSAEIQRLLQMGSGHTRLRNGKLAILPAETLSDLQEVLRDCNPSQTQPGVYRLLQAQGDYLASSLERWEVATAPSWQQWQARREKFRHVPDPTLPDALAKTLRPYQREGVRWLHLLATNRLGGILADEMGLGKTLQALAYLASTRDAQPATRNPQPSLIVCPTSLVDNWRREAAKFTPDLRTLPIDGADRAPLFAKIPGSDLVITSYALLRRDLDRYREHHFAAVVLDEAHHIKNPDSQVAMAACSLRSDQRFVLTGTPMENSVRDLWSIMHFALPGYLGNRQDFRERYELPLTRPGEPTADAVRERLTRRLRPVLLRRLKRDVAKDLPARIEQTSFCDLTSAQTQVYQQILAQSRLKLDAARAEKNPGRGRMLVLTSLLRLRQACCDLRLLGLDADCRAMGSVASAEGNAGILQGTEIEGRSKRRPAATGTVALPSEDTPAATTSGKLALLDELLEEIREGGHRVLIFSQFVSMLGLLRGHLDAAKTPFCYLDGSTKPRDRASEVERFQTDERVTAFLISVKAGGVGLNLTGADTVVHFDPWWNPAVEAQATDRAHRIGQTKVVTAYRLIARNTVEEKIFALQNRKRELTASLVERERDEPLLETLSFEEIEGLLE